MSLYSNIVYVFASNCRQNIGLPKRSKYFPQLFQTSRNAGLFWSYQMNFGRAISIFVKYYRKVTVFGSMGV